MILLRLAPAIGWQRFADGAVVASGAGWPAAGDPVVVAVPGEAVALHWLDLPELAPAQAAAAARMMLGDRLGEADPHVAVAPGGGLRAVAVVARAAMAAWLAECAAAGITPAAMVPEQVLLPEPARGWSVLAEAGRTIARSRDAALAAEPDLAALIIGDAPTEPAAIGLPDPLPLNLLVGDFAPQTRWQPPPGLWRRLGLLAAALAGLWLAGDVAGLLRARAAAASADAQTLAAAAPMLPAASADAESAAAQLQALARARGADGGLAALAAPLADAIAARPAGAGLASLAYTPAGGLVAGVAGGEGEARALADALNAAGLNARAGLTRATADGSITDVTVQTP
jgi:general secretion pathway protein L